MTPEEINEGNKLIAEFMGWNKYGNNVYHTPFENASYCNGEFTHIVNFPQDLKFNSSWDWLMPVVEKIESLLFYPKDIQTLGSKFYFIITNKFVSINGIAAGYPANKTDVTASKIDAVYQAVIEFIKWHNKNKFGNINN